MKICVKLYGNLRALMNRSEVEMVLKDSSTVADALADIATIGDKLHERIFDERGTLRSSLIILRNGSQIEAPDLTLPLADGDILGVLPRVAGGEPI
jgi:MoaD family protein